MSPLSLPVHKIAVVEDALQQTFGTVNVDCIDPLAGGLSSALVYKFSVKARPYVLRVMLHPNALSDPARIFPITELAAHAGITPRVYYADAESAVSITDFVAAKPLYSNYATRDALLADLAHTVQRIHALPPFPPLVNFMDGIDGFIDMFRASGRLPEAATADHFDAYAQLQQAYPRHNVDLVSSHNDLNYGNLLHDGTCLWVIDWEAAFLNDRYVDLAILANGFVTTAAEEELFLQAYFGSAPTDDQRARVRAMQPICHVYYAMIMLNLLDMRLPKGVPFDADMRTPTYAEFRHSLATGKVELGTDAGQLLFAKVALNEARRQMEAEHFQQALAQLREAA